MFRRKRGIECFVFDGHFTNRELLIESLMEGPKLVVLARDTFDK